MFSDPIDVSGAFQQATNSKMDFEDPKGLATCSNGLKKTSTMSRMMRKKMRAVLK